MKSENQNIKATYNKKINPIGDKPVLVFNGQCTSGLFKSFGGHGGRYDIKDSPAELLITACIIKKIPKCPSVLLILNIVKSESKARTYGRNTQKTIN